MNKTLLATNAHRILLSAIQAEFGIEVRVKAPNMIAPAMRGRQVLYRFKNEDPRFKDIHIRLHPDDPNNLLWLIRSDTGLIAQPEIPSPPTEMADLDIDL